MTASTPPSTGQATPLTKLAASEARKATTPATSSALPTRAWGATPATIRIPASMSPSLIVDTRERSIRVSIMPARTAFTRTPWRATSAAAVLVSPRIACLVAL